MFSFMQSTETESDTAVAQQAQPESEGLSETDIAHLQMIKDRVAANDDEGLKALLANISPAMEAVILKDAELLAEVQRVDPHAIDGGGLLDGLIDGALDLGSDVIDGARDLAEGALDLGLGALDGLTEKVVDPLWDAIGVDAGAKREAVFDFFGGGSEDIAEEAVEEAVEDKKTAVSPEDAMLNQHDNEFNAGGVHGGNMCSVTSLAMNLITLAGSESVAKTETIRLLKKHGSDGNVVEEYGDLVLRLINQLISTGYFEGLAAAGAPPLNFDTIWWTDPSNGLRAIIKSGKGHQSGYAQAITFSLHTGFVEDAGVSSTFSTGKDRKTWFLEDMADALQNGGVMLSTKLTGGHMVALVGVDDDGVRINDPNGAKFDAGYVKHGADAYENAKKVPTDEMERRFVGDSDRVGAMQMDKDNWLPRDDWGQNTKFDWAEVEKWTIGKMASLGKRGKGEETPTAETA